MEQFQTSALALQKHLLNLRQQLATLDAQGQQDKADQLATLIAHIEQALVGLPLALAPPTLQ